MPAFSNFANSSAAVWCFTGSKRRALAMTGWPLVLITCSTPLLTPLHVPDPLSRTVGYSANNCLMPGFVPNLAAVRPARPPNGFKGVGCQKLMGGGVHQQAVMF